MSYLVEFSVPSVDKPNASLSVSSGVRNQNLSLSQTYKQSQADLIVAAPDYSAGAAPASPRAATATPAAEPQEAGLMSKSKQNATPPLSLFLQHITHTTT